MKIKVQLVDQLHHFVGTDEKSNQAHFDSRSDDVFPAGPSPVSTLLQSLAACTGIDVADILRKKRKTITSLSIHADAERSEEHPRVFTKVNLKYELTSPDATVADLERCIHLSHEKYCSVSAMFRLSGCLVTTEAIVTA